MGHKYATKMCTEALSFLILIQFDSKHEELQQYTFVPFGSDDGQGSVRPALLMAQRNS